MACREEGYKPSGRGHDMPCLMVVVQIIVQATLCGGLPPKRLSSGVYHNAVNIWLCNGIYYEFNITIKR